MSKIQSYKITPDGYLLITSDSGSSYRLTPSSCSCKGFGFRKDCSHLQEAHNRKLFKLLKPKKSKLPFVRTPSIIESRLRSIRLYIEKNSIKSDEMHIKKAERLMTPSMTIEELNKILVKG